MAKKLPKHAPANSRLHHPACLALHGGPTDHEGACVGEAYGVVIEEKDGDRWVLTVRGPDDVIATCHNREYAESIVQLWNAGPHLYAACVEALRHHQGGHSEIGAKLRAAIDKANAI